MKNWYIIQSHSSFENKVASLIKEEAEKAKISEKIEEIIVPTHDITEVKRGKRVQRKKKYFPGYVLIKSEMDNNIYHMIKNIKRVSGFLGSKGIPVPVSDKEIEKILGQIKDGVAQPKSGIEYTIGEKVQVIDGPFAFDLAVSPEAAKIKGIDSLVAGKADIIIVPNIEMGNHCERLFK